MLSNIAKTKRLKVIKYSSVCVVASAALLQVIECKDSVFFFYIGPVEFNR